MCATDPLLFTCELYEAVFLRVVLPNNHHETISVGDTNAQVALPAGFITVSLDIDEHTTDSFKRNISLTLFVVNASLLACGDIKCEDEITEKVVTAGCLPDSKLLRLEGGVHIRLQLSYTQFVGPICCKMNEN